MKERRQSPSEEDLVEKIATNPIHAYKMMKRFTVDWKSLQVLISNTLVKIDSNTIFNLKDFRPF